MVHSQAKQPQNHYGNIVNTPVHMIRSYGIKDNPPLPAEDGSPLLLPGREDVLPPMPSGREDFPLPGRVDVSPPLPLRREDLPPPLPPRRDDPPPIPPRRNYILPQVGVKSNKDEGYPTSCESSPYSSKKGSFNTVPENHLNFKYVLYLVCTHACMYVYVWVHVCVCVGTCVRVRVCMRVCACMCVHAHMCV